MRRLVVVVSAVFLAVLLVSSVALSAELGPDDQQYEPSGGSETSADTRDDTRDVAPDDDTSKSDDFVSQGSSGTGDTPEARAARRDLAEEARKPYYSQIVDNTTRGRFVAPGWKRVSGAGNSYRGSHVVAAAGSDARNATFRMKVPANDDYAVYAWWSAAKNNATAARFVIPSASGPKTEKVDETREGGIWIRLGVFDLKKGERTIRVSPSEDANVVADAVMIIRDEQAPLPNDAMSPAQGGDTMRASTTTSATRYSILQQARRYIGKKYRWGECTAYYMSCTCLTRRAVYPFGHNFPMTELGQWRYQPSARVLSWKNLQPGDILFYTEPYPPSGIDHVGVYAGGGYIVHSSSYWGQVVEKPMKYIKGYYGAKRVWPR